MIKITTTKNNDKNTNNDKKTTIKIRTKITMTKITMIQITMIKITTMIKIKITITILIVMTKINNHNGKYNTITIINTVSTI